MRSTDGTLAKQVDALAAVKVATLPIGALMELVQDTVGPINRLAGVVSRAVGELAVRGGGQVPDPAVTGAVCPTPAWLRAAGNITGNTAGRQIRTAVALRELPAVAEAIVDGQLTVEHGRVLARLVGPIEPAALLASQPQLIEVASRLDPEQLASYVRHLIATWCPPALEAQEAAAEDRRFLQLRNTHNGSWRGTFQLPDAAMEPLLTVLEALARRDGNADKRTSGQRRADALTDVFGLALRYADLPDTGGSRPLLTHIIPAPDRHDGFTLDLDRHPGAHCTTAPWTGPATHTQIQTMLCDARTQTVVLDDTGQIISLTSTTDQITNAQRRAIAARDRCCTTKGCTKPPAFCDVHHLVARADGGLTEIGNLVLLCRRHHVMWHRNQLHLTDLRTPWLRLPQPRAPALE